MHTVYHHFDNMGNGDDAVVQLLKPHTSTVSSEEETSNTISD